MIHESSQDDAPGIEKDEQVLIAREKRSTSRQPSRARFKVKVDESLMEGMGTNISQTGAYFVTCDEVMVELKIEGVHGRRDVPARIVRMDRISESSFGIAVRFDHRIPCDEF